jgi:hypothetical protein
MKSLLFAGTIALCLIVSCKKNSIPAPPLVTGDLSPTISSFSPETGYQGTPVEITGSHFDTSASNIQVAFNGIVATIYAINDSNILVFVPAGAVSGKISVTKGAGKAFSSDNFTLLTGGSWVQKQSMVGQDSSLGRYVGIGFSIGNKGYMGMGTDGNINFYSDLNEYDPATGLWTPKANIGFGFAVGVCMVINNIAYVGIGLTGTVTYTNAFYAYDPVADTWTRKADFPGASRAAAFGIGLGNIGLVGFGVNQQNGLSYQDIWVYDPTMDSWTQKANFPGVLTPSFPIGFTLDNKTAYIGGTVTEYDENVNIWYQYDPVADTWTIKNARPGSQYYELDNAMVINGTGYIMGGTQNWMYQPVSDTWVQVPFFGQRVGGSAFVIGNAGYFGLGSGIPGNVHLDLWQFTP